MIRSLGLSLPITFLLSLSSVYSSSSSSSYSQILTTSNFSTSTLTSTPSLPSRLSLPGDSASHSHQFSKGRDTIWTQQSQNSFYSRASMATKISKQSFPRFLSQEDSHQVDVDLMNPETYAYTTEQLMELAGQAVAHALVEAVPSARTVLILCGPGNNGGDGLIAARHLVHFGRTVTVYYPKPSKNSHLMKLVKQCEVHDIKLVSDLPSSDEIDGMYDVVCDAIFGFSFKVDEKSDNPIRPPFDKAIQTLVSCKAPIVAVDIPSGWDVEKGAVLDDKLGLNIDPYAVVSLTAPKKCMIGFKRKHYLGGLFVPKSLAEKYNLNLPVYPPNAIILDLSDDVAEASL